jgi:hypothetical protein
MSERRVRSIYPAVPTDLKNPSDMVGLNRIFAALRERVEIYARERGRVEDSMVRVQDLIDLGVITPAQAQTLTARRIDR